MGTEPSGRAKRPCRLFIFDLDGTLIDSQADLVTSLNLALAKLGHETLSSGRIGGFVGEGVQKLIERALRAVTGREPGEESVQEATRAYMEEYSHHLLEATHLRDHAREALDALSGAWCAVVTNKPERFAKSILDGLGIGGRFAVVLGGDSVEHRKPEPEALFKAMEFCGTTPAETAMIGDSLTDIDAGKAAGAMTCALLGGFRPDEELRGAGSDFVIGDLIELPDCFIPVPAR
ncbi:MAG: HAD-IA family hydrolase [Acidobacteriota bacterium]|nr:HAD-IA family hydrolase [Acidobacteriota bacterium]